MTHDNYAELYSKVIALEKARNEAVEKAFKKIEDICAERNLVLAAIEKEIVEIRDRICRKIAEAK